MSFELLQRRVLSLERKQIASGSVSLADVAVVQAEVDAVEVSVLALIAVDVSLSARITSLEAVSHVAVTIGSPANGLSITAGPTGQVLSIALATTGTIGVVSATTQSFSGAKTFLSTVAVTSDFTVDTDLIHINVSAQRIGFGAAAVTHPWEFWNSLGVLRTSIRTTGIQEWYLNDGAGSEVGSIAYGTPAGVPGIVFGTANPSSLSRTDIRHRTTGGLDFGAQNGLTAATIPPTIFSITPSGTSQVVGTMSLLGTVTASHILYIENDSTSGYSAVGYKNSSGTEKFSMGWGNSAVGATIVRNYAFISLDNTAPWRMIRGVNVLLEVDASNNFSVPNGTVTIGTVLALSQTNTISGITNKTFTSPTINSATFTGTLAMGTSTISGTPNFSGAATLGGVSFLSQTNVVTGITNKTFTDPVINGATMSGTLALGTSTISGTPNFSGAATIGGVSFLSQTNTVSGITNKTFTNPTINAATFSGALAFGSSTFTGTNLSGTNTGDQSLAIGAIGSSPDAKGATASGMTLTLQPCDSTNPGVIKAGDQVLTTGVKTVDAIGVGASAPAAPSAGVRIASIKRAGRTLPAFQGPNGTLQRMLVGKRSAMTMSNGGAGTLINLGLALNVGVAFNGALWANTNIRTQAQRSTTTSGASAGSSITWRETVNKYSRGASAGLGGFHLVCRMGFSAIPATFRWFFGLRSISTAIGNIDPSSMVDMIGIGQDVGDTNVKFMHNDSSGTATKDNGSNAMTPPTTSDWLELQIYCAPNDTSVYMSAEKLNGGTLTEYTATGSELPANTLGLTVHGWANNESTAADVTNDFGFLYIETDY